MFETTALVPGIEMVEKIQMRGLLCFRKNDDYFFLPILKQVLQGGQCPMAGGQFFALQDIKMLPVGKAEEGDKSC